MKKIVISLSIMITLFSLSAFAKDGLTVSILPQKYFVEKIAKDNFEVTVMVSPGASPATYEPKISQMKLLSKSKAYFSIGVPFEKVWLERFETANPNMLIVDTSKGIQKQKIAAHSHHEEEHDDHEEHGHEENHEHNEHENHEEHGHEKHDDHEEHGHDNHKDEHDEKMHEGLDPHIWLDPVLVKTQAKNILEALVKIDPKNKKFYYENYKSFLVELDELHNELTNILKPIRNKKFMVFHPSWGYFAKRYELEQIAVEKEGKEPKPSELVELVKEAKEQNIKAVFVAPQFSKSSAQTIAKNIDGKTITINPLSYEWKNSIIRTSKK